MTTYSAQPRDQVFVKCYGFSSFAKNMGENIGENINKIINGKYSQILLNHAKNSATDGFKTFLKRVIQKTAEATGNLISNKIANYELQKTNNKIIQKQLQISMIKLKIPKERYVSSEERQEIIDELRLK